MKRSDLKKLIKEIIKEALDGDYDIPPQFQGDKHWEERDTMFAISNALQELGWKLVKEHDEGHQSVPTSFVLEQCGDANRCVQITLRVIKSGQGGVHYEYKVGVKLSSNDFAGFKKKFGTFSKTSDGEKAGQLLHKHVTEFFAKVNASNEYHVWLRKAISYHPNPSVN